MTNLEDDFLNVEDSFRQQLEKELIDAMMFYSANRPRSLQKHIGPSQAGTTCARKLAYALNSEAALPRQEDNPLPSMIGTAMHETQEEVFLLQNALRAQKVHEELEVRDLMDRLREDRNAFGEPRWLTENKVLEPIPGTCDLFDTVNGTVIDHKFLGPTSFPKAVKQLPVDYEVQDQLYGYGMMKLGYDVKQVGNFLVPRGGRLKNSKLILMPFDPEVAERAYERVQEVQYVSDMLGVRENPYRYRRIPATPTEHNCQFCPFFVPGPVSSNPWWCQGVSGQVDANGHLVNEGVGEED